MDLLEEEEESKGESEEESKEESKEEPKEEDDPQSKIKVRAFLEAKEALEQQKTYVFDLLPLLIEFAVEQGNAGQLQSALLVAGKDIDLQQRRLEFKTKGKEVEREAMQAKERQLNKDRAAQERRERENREDKWKIMKIMIGICIAHFVIILLLFWITKDFLDGDQFTVLLSACSLVTVTLLVSLRTMYK